MSGSGTSWAICKSAPRSRQITTPAPTTQFFTGRMPFLPPNQQRQSTEGNLTDLLIVRIFTCAGAAEPASLRGPEQPSQATRPAPPAVDCRATQPSHSTCTASGRDESTTSFTVRVIWNVTPALSRARCVTDMRPTSTRRRSQRATIATRPALDKYHSRTVSRISIPSVCRGGHGACGCECCGDGSDNGGIPAGMDFITAATPH